MTIRLNLEPFCNAPNGSQVRLVWRSEGRGDPERHVLQTLEPGVHAIEIPNDAPLSYDGQLFRIIWQLELWHQEQLLDTRALRIGLNTPDPYVLQGLKRNPFALEIGAVPAHLWLDRSSNIAPLANSKTLWQFLGVKGAGKSSQLQHWCDPTWHSRLTPPPVASIAYWDEADRIAPVMLYNALTRAARFGSTIVVGTHRDLSAEALRSGITNVVTIRLVGISRSQLLEWAAQRIQASSLPDGTAYTISEDDADTMLEQSPDSWRELASLLHSHCASWMTAHTG
jgi:hypothetical protein